MLTSDLQIVQWDRMQMLMRTKPCTICRSALYQKLKT